MKPTKIQRGVDRGPGGPGAVLLAGPEPEKAAATVLCIHGRGAPAQSILALFGELGIENLAAIAPEAPGRSWYPHSFLSPLEANQPYLDNALARIDWHVAELVARGVPEMKIAFLGFSQGACLATEFIATHPARYAGLIAWTGGLIGPPNSDLTHTGDLAGTPALFASSDPDAWVPFQRVEESARIYTAMGAQVTLRRFPDKPHSISGEEIELGRKLIDQAFAPKK